MHILKSKYFGPPLLAARTFVEMGEVVCRGSYATDRGRSNSGRSVLFGDTPLGRERAEALQLFESRSWSVSKKKQKVIM